MRILVTGAFGFIGSHIVAALTAAGHVVVCAARRPDRSGRFASLPFVACDLATDTHVEDWLPRLAGIDAVVNAAGILREQGRQTFAAIHDQAPRALFAACAQAGVRRVIQVSALGDPRDGEFIRSKQAADDFLATLGLDWTVLRPSVVYSPAGSYGGTSLLRALASMPWLLGVPGDGRQRLQPIAAEDLARTVATLVGRPDGNRRVLEATGPEVVTLTEYLLALRQWLGFGTPRVLHIPLPLVRLAAQFGEWIGRGPLGLTMFRMLVRGNVAQPGAAGALAAAAGFPPRSLQQVLAASPSHVQDRWHARLYLVAPLLRGMLALLFLASGYIGFMHPLERSVILLGFAGIPANLAPATLYLASAADLLLGVLILTRYQRQAAWGMLLMLAGYTLFLGFRMPGLWMEPFGSLIKNIPLIPAVLVMVVLADRR